ncbi:MAG TPA: hypothetical protein PLU37_04940 [Chitinophagaceae bacterium]|nr:hypothetical protein [Chitinophagaceae bacterium]MCB9055795.1 hypothetical protein [Chitinophagales bacterium]HPG10854.1 hypothetical protein [Chitinophagaceae bacterium]HRX94953.1 hypothetical protein [Chitinophagaceae bacterium]
MRLVVILITLLYSVSGHGQEIRDTVLRQCPVFITDTVSSNNFFIEGLPVTLRVYRVRGELTVQFQQRDQYFTIFFHTKKLKNRNYIIDDGSHKRKEVEVAYSFKSGDQVSFISLSTGRLEVLFDQEKDMWNMKVSGLIRNMVERSVTYYKARADFYIR